MIKHLFSDMDGTILDDAGVVSDSNANIIKATHLPLTLVSARAPIEMLAAMDKLDLTAPQIAFNGGLIFKHNSNKIEILKDDTINSNTTESIVDHVRTEFPDVSISWYTLNGWFSEKIDDGIKLEQGYTDLLPQVTARADFFANNKEPLFKIMLIIFDKGVMSAIKKSLMNQNYPGVAIQQSSDTYLEITSKNAVKSAGMQFIIDQENLKPSEMMAFGDGHNDLPMMQLVEHRVVMKNALPEVLKVATYVTKTNQEDGVGYALQHYL